MKMLGLLIVLMFLMSVCVVEGTVFYKRMNQFTKKFDFYTLEANNLTFNVDCSDINFTGTIGSSEICDGLDAGTGVTPSPWYDAGTYVRLNSTYADNVKMWGYINMRNNTLTDAGSLVMTGTLTSWDIIPVTNATKSLGNSTHWWDDIHVKTVYANDIYADFIETTVGNITTVNSDDVNSDRATINDNLTVGTGVWTEVDGNMVFVMP